MNSGNGYTNNARPQHSRTGAQQARVAGSQQAQAAARGAQAQCGHASPAQQRSAARGAQAAGAGGAQQQPQQRPSRDRDTLVRMYDAQNATRARNTRMYSQEAMQSFQQREAMARERNMQREAFAARSREEQLEAARSGRKANATSHMTQAQAQQRAREIRARNRIRQPLTTQESHDQTQMSREAYEHERARRDVLSPAASSRTSNREVIDGRGSIDSRAFNEKNELVGYSIDERDRPDPTIENTDSPSRWNSHAGQGFMAPEGRGLRRNADLGSLSDAISGRSDFHGAKGGLASVPASIKFLVVLIVVLLGVLAVLLFF